MVWFIIIRGVFVKQQHTLKVNIAGIKIYKYWVTRKDEITNTYIKEQLGVALIDDKMEYKLRW